MYVSFSNQIKKNPTNSVSDRGNDASFNVWHVRICCTMTNDEKNQSSFLRMSLGLMGTELFYVSLSVAHLWHVTSSSSELNHLVILSDWHV